MLERGGGNEEKGRGRFFGLLVGWVDICGPFSLTEEGSFVFLLGESMPRYRCESSELGSGCWCAPMRGRELIS